MSAAKKLLRDLAEKLADDRAHRIASMAAEELIRYEGEKNGDVDVFVIPDERQDDHMRECIAHLCWHGEAASLAGDDGSIVVMFGDFSVGC